MGLYEKRSYLFRERMDGDGVMETIVFVSLIVVVPGIYYICVTLYDKYKGK